jgi:chemotaxis family two-component system sensor histidine kinase/response regulator PixL
MSSIDPQIRDQAYQFFSQEALEFLQTIEDGLMHLRTDRSVPQVHSLMRAAHSIKGGAASVELVGIQKIAHRLEDVFRALYRQDKEIDVDVEELLLQAFDCLRAPLVEQIETGYYDAESAIQKAEPIFMVLEEYLGDSLGADLELPTAAELGFDIAQVVFAGDVAMGLERLQAVMNHPEKAEVSGEIRAQSEVFSGIAELLNLPGFKAIAQTTLQALDAHPENPLMVGKVAVANFVEAQAVVLAGDRTQGGSPSAELLALAGATDASIPLAQVPMDLANELGNEFELTDTFTSTFSDDISIGTNDDLGSLDLGLLDTDTFADSFTDSFADTSFSERFADIDSESSLDGLAGLDALASDRAVTGFDPDFGAGLDELNALCENIDDNPIVDANANANAFNDEQISEFQPASSFADDADLNSIGSLEDMFSGAIGAEADRNLGSEFGSGFAAFATPAIALPNTEIPQEIAKQAASGDTSGTVAPEITPSTPAIEIAPKPSARVEIAPDSKAATSSSPAQLAAMVRVDLGRMERLNNLVGELVTQENGALLQNQQLQETLRTLQRRFDRFEQIAKELEKCLDTSQTSQVKSRSTGLNANLSERNSASLTASLNPTNALSELESFDPLLMDSYSYVYTVVQESLEEIAQMGETMRDMTLLTQQTQQTQYRKQQTLKLVRNDLLWARMMPLSEILQRFPRMVRDLGAKNDKQVKLKTVGANTLVDKAVLEKLFDPMVHLIRNAFDHGTETPEVRKKQGKPSEATIEIRAYHRGNQTYIEVRDDGRGIDIEKVRSVAIAREVMTSTEAAVASPTDLYELLFSPSFSTADKVSEISGRGMGLPAVRSQIGSLKGSITISSELGQGTVFTIRLPLTLTIAKLLIFSIGSNQMAIPVDTLVGIVTAADSEVQTIQGKQFYRYQDSLVPLFPHSAFPYSYPLPKNTEELVSTMELPSEDGIPLLIVSSGEQTIALEVDQILSEQELVIKPFSKAIASPSYLYGCTIQGDGSMLPVIDGLALVSKLLNPQPEVLSSRTQRLLANMPAVPTSQQEAETILVVDDSLTTRQTLALTLKKAGYRVVQAGDGREALDKLSQEANIEAVFCDVEMPRMNGFEFLSQCRQDRQYLDLPVIMLTSRAGEKHRALAKLLKATAYLTKPYLEQELLNTLRACLKGQPLERQPVSIS